MTFPLSSGAPWSPIHRTGGGAAIAFVVAAVVALAVVPLVIGSRAARAQGQIAEVLDPARLLGTRLSLIQARQMFYFQAFLVTGNHDFEAPYLSAMQEEQVIVQELQTLIGGMDLMIRERLARLSSASLRWHVEHQDVFDSEEARLERVQAFDQERARYEAMQEATLGLEQAIQTEVDAGRLHSERLRTLETRISLGLLLLGLGATAAVSLVGSELRALATETDERRKDAVRARREMDAILEATADGVLGMDLNGKVLTLNRAGSQLLGYPERELRGMDVHDALCHATRDGVERPRPECPILRALSTGVEARSEGGDVLWRKNGSTLPVLWSLRPMLDGRVVRGAVLTFTDLTEILRKEEALRRAVRVREEVVSVVSHDLRNPLAVVAGAADLLLDLPLEEAERRQQAEIIRRSAERMSRLIENLLDIARIEAGALVVRPVAQRPEEVLADVEAFFAPQAEPRGITLSVETEPGLPAVLADPDRVQQALANLVDNALRFSPVGGRVTLGAHAHPRGGIALTVGDQGPGIAEADRTRVFDRFWQASRHDRTGSGLGLAIVRGIAEAHGGSVDVESEPGEGARFTMVLPAAPASAQTGERSR